VTALFHFGQGVGPLTKGPIQLVNGPQGGGPVPGGPGFVVLNSFDFKPYSQIASYQYAGTLLWNLGDYSYYIAPVHLPQGATINQVVAYYIDNDGVIGKDIEIDMLLLNDFTTSGDVMAAISSEGLPISSLINYAVTSSIFYPVVDNSRYSYLVQVGMPNSANVALSAVRIDYTYSLSLPAVMR
jgi:hypothetical protein